jgi:hypothetical protein
MSWRRQVAKLGALFRRLKPVDDLEEEMRSHLRMEEQENLESGMPPGEAHYAALRRFGNVTLAQERSREMWGWDSVETLWQDLRHGLRMLVKDPGFTAVAVLTLALGIGANTAIFSLFDTVMLRLLPVQKPEELVLLQWHDPLQGDENSQFTNPLWEQLRDRQDVFRRVCVGSCTQDWYEVPANVRCQSQKQNQPPQGECCPHPRLIAGEPEPLRQKVRPRHR